ncbi:MAG: hypothetical protein IJN56_04515 [Clostridia bacterium]|nr:hypothetical protein [Clostridia bacterium]
MKKYIKAILSILLVVALISVCGCVQKNKYVKDLRNDNYKNEEDKNNMLSSTKGTPLDPFEGLVVEFDGISPFCTISFNNSRCNEDVQLNVEYSVEPYDIITTEKHFKINEEVTVYATLKNPNVDEQEYYLTSTTKGYKVENVPEYITELTDDMDLSVLKTEVDDYLKSITSFSANSNLGAWNIYDSLGWSELYKDSREPQKDKVFFCSLKMKSYDTYSKEICFNKIVFTHEIELMGHYDTSFQKRYFSIVAKNIVRYPDGIIGWGEDDPKSLSFEYNVDSNNMESLINSNVTQIKADYNVTEITNILQ